MTSTVSQLFIGVFVSLLVLVTVSGNLLVCLAIYLDSRLRRTENLFLASLAVSDLLVAVLVMTVAGVNDLLGYWVFGSSLCDIWIGVDIMCSTASILNLCAISMDRYLHIRDPFRYSNIVTKRVAVLSIFIIWTLSATIAFVPIYRGMHRSNPKALGDPHPSTCAMDLSPAYAVISSLFSFYLPCLIMLSIYSRLYLYSRRQSKSISGLGPVRSHQNDHKAAITIGVLMGIFLGCWLPFFCANVLVSVCKTCVAPSVFKVFSWLGYANSMFDPIVYSILNSDFRDSFKLILMRKLSAQMSLTSSLS